MSKTYSYTIVSSQISTAGVLIILLRSDSPHTLDYKPGQYAAISFIHRGRPTIARCFSMASSPTESGYLEFALSPGKGLSQTTAGSLVPGTKVMVEGPFGDLIFNEKRDTSALFLVEEIGIAPIVSMLRYAARQQLASDLLLLYACPSQDNIPLAAEVLQLEQANPRLKVVFVLGAGMTDKLPGQHILRGVINQPVLNQILSGTYTARTYFVSGSAGFIHDTTKLLLASGAPIESIVAETARQGQETSRHIRHSIPLQVYALTGLSLLLGTAATLGGESPATIAASSPDLGGSASENQLAQNSSNSRQDAVDQAISQLQTGTSTGSSLNNSGTGSSAAPSTAGSGPKAPASGGSASSGSGSSTSGSSGTSGGSSSGSGGSTGGGTATPPPAVAPSLTFQASNTAITSGQSVTLTWSINSNATSPVSCTAGNGWSGSKGTGGSQSVKPSSNTTYTLTCSNSAGSSTKSVTINVAPACVSTPSNPC
ncbi:MAG TPA: hypothetical protein VGM08_03035 [Candidatus Saccharimonadales bacterium]|jgi:ferredoxin-NADP reductase